MTSETLDPSSSLDVVERLKQAANGNPVIGHAIAEIEYLRKIKAQSKPKLFICLPAYGQQVTAQTTSTLVNLVKFLTEQQMLGGFGTLSFPSIMELRNLFLSIWYYKVQTSHLLMIDNDMQFDVQLIMDMVAFDKPVVGALCPKRKLPIEYAGRAKPGECRVVNNFLEVDGIGGAVMMIKREAVDAIIAKHPDILDSKSPQNHAAKQLMEEQGITTLIRAFDEMKIDGEHFSEDLSFCKRAQAAGFDIWANIGHEITHVGPHEYKARYLDQIKDQIVHKQPFHGNAANFNPLPKDAPEWHKAPLPPIVAGPPVHLPKTAAEVAGAEAPRRELVAASGGSGGPVPDTLDSWRL